MNKMTPAEITFFTAFFESNFDLNKLKSGKTKTVTINNSSFHLDEESGFIMADVVYQNFINGYHPGTVAPISNKDYYVNQNGFGVSKRHGIGTFFNAANFLNTLG